MSYFSENNAPLLIKNTFSNIPLDIQDTQEFKSIIKKHSDELILVLKIINDNLNDIQSIKQRYNSIPNKLFSDTQIENIISILKSNDDNITQDKLNDIINNIEDYDMFYDFNIIREYFNKYKNNEINNIDFYQKVDNYFKTTGYLYFNNKELFDYENVALKLISDIYKFSLEYNYDINFLLFILILKLFFYIDKLNEDDNTIKIKDKIKTHFDSLDVLRYIYINEEVIKDYVSKTFNINIEYPKKGKDSIDLQPIGFSKEKEIQIGSDVFDYEFLSNFYNFDSYNVNCLDENKREQFDKLQLNLQPEIFLPKLDKYYYKKRKKSFIDEESDVGFIRDSVNYILGDKALSEFDSKTIYYKLKQKRDEIETKLNRYSFIKKDNDEAIKNFIKTKVNIDITDSELKNIKFLIKKFRADFIKINDTINNIDDLIKKSYYYREVVKEFFKNIKGDNNIWNLKNCVNCKDDINLNPIGDVNDLISIKLLEKKTNFGVGHCVSKKILSSILKTDLLKNRTKRSNGKKYIGDTINIFSIWEKETSTYDLVFKLNIENISIFITIDSLKKIFKVNEKIFYAVPLFSGINKRIGNLGNIISQGQLHGQTPGYKVYKLFTKNEIKSCINKRGCFKENENDFIIKYINEKGEETDSKKELKFAWYIKDMIKNQERVYDRLAIYVIDIIINNILNVSPQIKGDQIKYPWYKKFLRGGGKKDEFFYTTNIYTLAEKCEKSESFMKECKKHKNEICINLLERIGYRLTVKERHKACEIVKSLIELK